MRSKMFLAGILIVLVIACNVVPRNAEQTSNEENFTSDLTEQLENTTENVEIVPTLNPDSARPISPTLKYFETEWVIDIGKLKDISIAEDGTIRGFIPKINTRDGFGQTTRQLDAAFVILSPKGDIIEAIEIEELLGEKAIVNLILDLTLNFYDIQATKEGAYFINIRIPESGTNMGAMMPNGEVITFSEELNKLRDQSITTEGQLILLDNVSKSSYKEEDHDLEGNLISINYKGEVISEYPFSEKLSQTPKEFYFIPEEEKIILVSPDGRFIEFPNIGDYDFDLIHEFCVEAQKNRPSRYYPHYFYIPWAGVATPLVKKDELGRMSTTFLNLTFDGQIIEITEEQFLMLDDIFDVAIDRCGYNLMYQPLLNQVYYYSHEGIRIENVENISTIPEFIELHQQTMIGNPTPVILPDGFDGGERGYYGGSQIGYDGNLYMLAEENKLIKCVLKEK